MCTYTYILYFGPYEKPFVKCLKRISSKSDVRGRPNTDPLRRMNPGTLPGSSGLIILYYVLYIIIITRSCVNLTFFAYNKRFSKINKSNSEESKERKWTLKRNKGKCLF